MDETQFYDAILNNITKLNPLTQPLSRDQSNDDKRIANRETQRSVDSSVVQRATIANNSDSNVEKRLDTDVNSTAVENNFWTFERAFLIMGAICLGASVGTLAGTLIGAATGTPVGVAIGSVIGMVVGAVLAGALMYRYELKEYEAEMRLASVASEESSPLLSSDNQHSPSPSLSPNVEAQQSDNRSANVAEFHSSASSNAIPNVRSRQSTNMSNNSSGFHYRPIQSADADLETITPDDRQVLKFN